MSMLIPKLNKILIPVQWPSYRYHLNDCFPISPLQLSRRASGWGSNRPSIVGVLAAQRFGTNLMRKLRNSQTPSKRGSTCGDRAEPPPPNLEPTYRLEPKAPFQPSKVEEVGTVLLLLLLFPNQGEADDRQVTTVFTVQPSFHHGHSTNRVSWSVTIVGERAVTPHLVVRRRW